MCVKDINQSFTSMCVKETHPLPLIKSQALLFTVIRVEEMLMPKNSREADLGEMPQASAGWAARGAQTRTSLSLSWAVRGNIPANPGLYCLTAKCPSPGNMADNLHRCTEPRALPDVQGPLARHVQQCTLCLGVSRSSWLWQLFLLFLLTSTTTLLTPTPNTQTYS